MTGNQRDDSTSQLIADAESLRGKPAGKRPPRTRQLVRDAERLIGRAPAAPGSGRALLVALVLALAALGIAAFFLVFA